MGSQTLEILRQGVLASLTGGWFYDVHQNVFCNAVHLYIWLFLLFLPFIIYMYFPKTVLVWSVYCVLIAIIISVFKFINVALHRMYDKARTMSDTNLKKPVKAPREASGEDETGIEMQEMGAVEVVETPPVDMSSRTSVERHSDEISCANSAISIDYQEQVTSTIDLKVDVHRKNSSESSDGNGAEGAEGGGTKSIVHSSTMQQTHSAEVCSSGGGGTHKRSLSTPNQGKSLDLGTDNQGNGRGKDMVDAEEGAAGVDPSKEGGKKSATLRRHQYKSKRKQRFMNSQLQRQISLDSEKIGMGIVFADEVAAGGGAHLQRHLSSEDQNNKSNTSLFHHHHHHHHMLALQNLDPDLYMDHSYTKSAVQLAVENIPGETTSKIYLLQQSTPIRRDSNSTMSALQLPTMVGNSSGKNRRHSNANSNAVAGVRPMPRSLTSVRRIKSAALETCSPSSISNLAPTHPNSVEVIGGQTLRNPQHTVLPPPSKSLSRNPHLNLFPKSNGDSTTGLVGLGISLSGNPSNNEPVYPIAEQADESTPVKNPSDKVEKFEPNSDSDAAQGDEDDDNEDDDADHAEEKRGSIFGDEDDDDDDDEEDEDEDDEDDEAAIDRLRGGVSEDESVHAIHTHIHRHHHHHHHTGGMSRQHSQQSNPPSHSQASSQTTGPAAMASASLSAASAEAEQDTDSDPDQPAALLQSTDSDTENNAGSRSPLLEPRNRAPLVIVEAKNMSCVIPSLPSAAVEGGLKLSKSSDKMKKSSTLTIEDSPVKQGFEENGGPSSSDWEQASASSKDLLITKERTEKLGKSEIPRSSSGNTSEAVAASGSQIKSQENWFKYTGPDEDCLIHENEQQKKDAGNKELEREKSGSISSEGTVAVTRNLGAIPKTSSSRITSRRLSAEENYPSSSSKIYNRTLSQRLSAERIPENATAAPLITFLNYRSEVPIPPIYLPGNSSLSEQQTSSFTSFRRRFDGSDRSYRQIQCRLRMSRSKHPVVSMEPNNSGGAGPSGTSNSAAGSFRDDDNNNCNYCIDSLDNPTTSSRSVGGSSSTFHDQTEVPLSLFVDEPERWVQLIERATIENVIKERIAMSRGSAGGGVGSSGDNNNTSINSSGIDKAMAPTEYSLSSAQSAIDVVPRSMFGESQIRPKRYYKFPVHFLCFKELSISMNRLQLLALFDRDTNWFQVALAILLCTLVSLLGSTVLYLKFYEDLYAFIFCFVIAGSQYSLLKSVQPDAASPIHGFNKTVTYSRPIYFCLCSSLLLGAHHLLREYQLNPDSVMDRVTLFGFHISIIDSLQCIQSILSVVILLFPFLFSLGLFPQINTFAMYFLEQIDMHIFGSNAACSLLSSFLSIIRSMLACTLLFGPAFGGLSETGTQHVLFSMFCAFLITVSYHLSRCSSDFTYIWAVIKSSLIVHPDYDDSSKEDSKMSTDSEDNKMESDHHQRSSDEIHKDLDEEANRGESTKELDDPLPKKLQSTVTARLKNDAVVSVALSTVIFSLHCSTVFTVLQPDINYVLHTGACILGFAIHYMIPQLRKHLPWLCIAKPILKAKEFGQFEVQNLSKIMWFETMYVGLCFFERNILYPLIFLSALTADSGAIAGKFGLTMGTVLVVVSGLKCVRNAYSDIGSQYIILIFTVLFFRIDYKLSSETFLIDYFFVSILYRKISEFLLKLQFVVTYIAPWQITWGSAFHAFAQPFSVPHSAMLFLQTAISALLSTPLNPFLGSAIFLTSYVRPIKFWERDYNTRRIDHSNTRLSSQLERDLGADDNNLNSIFYEHLTRSLQHSLCGDLLMGRWGNVSQGDCFVLASDYLNCLVHIIELGNGLCTFQMRGLEFRGTYCQQREVEAISEEVEENIGCCCCTVGHLPRMLSANAMFTTRWLAWQVMASKYVLEGYSISDNSATATLQVFEFRKVLISYYVKSIIYYAIRSAKLVNWLQSQAIEEALEHTLDRQFVDLDPVFNHNLDDDYDFRAAGITRVSFWNVYGEWIQFCCDKKRQQMQAALNEKNTPKKNAATVANATAAPGSLANDTGAKGTSEGTPKEQSEQQSNNGAKQNPAEGGESSTNGAATSSSGNNGCSIAGTSGQPFFSSNRESLVTSLCMALALLARRTLATASHSSSCGVEFFLHGLHALFKGDFRITSTRDEWVFADMELLHGVVAPAVRMSLKLHQDHFLCPDEYDDYGALFNAIDYHTKELVISHEADPLWRNAVLRGTPNLLALRHVMDDGSDEYRVIRLSKRFLSFRVIKLNRECVRGLWAGQQQELIYLRNRNPERGSIQNAKQALRNIINSSCDQPIGYPIYVSPLTTSYAETNPQLCRIIGGEITLEKIVVMINSFFNRVRQRCREGCSSGSAIIDNEMGEIQGVYCNTPTPNNTLSGTAGTLSYGSQNMSLSGAANRGSLASINKPTSSTLLAGLLIRERDSERETLRDRAGVTKRNLSSNSKDRIDRALAASKRESFKEALASGSGLGAAGIGGSSNNSSLKQQESVESTSGNAKSNNSSSMNLNMPNSSATNATASSSVMLTLSPPPCENSYTIFSMTEAASAERVDGGGMATAKAGGGIRGNEADEQQQPSQSQWINAPPTIGLNRKVIIVDAAQIYDCLDLGRRIDVIWPNEQFRSYGGRSSWKDWQPQEGMVGNIVHYWQPNHPDHHFRSNVNRTILLMKIGDRYVPIGEKGVKEYNTIGLISATTGASLPAASAMVGSVSKQPSVEAAPPIGSISVSDSLVATSSSTATTSEPTGTSLESGPPCQLSEHVCDDPSAKANKPDPPTVSPDPTLV